MECQAGIRCFCFRSLFKLIAKGTIEENIVRLQESKKDLAEQVVAEGQEGMGKLSRGEVLWMLREMA